MAVDMLIGMISRALVFAFAVVLAFPSIPVRADDAASNVLKSDDGKVQLSVPDGWVKSESTTPSAVLEARNEDSDAFIMVLVADRSDPYLTLDDYSGSIRDDVLSHLVKSKCSQPESLEIGGFKAIRFEIHGTKPDSKMAFGYFLTIIQMHHHYVQVVGWAMEKVFADDTATLRDAAKNVSFSGD
jgi:hypothetical protein